MASYFSTFISGFQEVVKTALEKQLGDVSIKIILDGLVAYSSDRSLQTIKGLRFINNTFLLAHVFQLSKIEIGDRPIEAMMLAVLHDPELFPGVPRWAKKGAANFRIMAARENQTESVDGDLLRKSEKFFSYRLGLKINRSQPDLEVWFLTRSEGYGLLGVRLTRTQNSEKNLRKGELRPELTNLLCLVSEPSKEDVFLDPFAGSGSIPLERAKAFPFKKIIACEKDKDVFKKLQNRVQQAGLKITLGRWDALDLSSIASGSVTKIVTDPPWGIYSQSTSDLGAFYFRMLAEFIRIVPVGGLICILMGQKGLFETTLSQFPELRILARYDILVSGKKAAVFKLRKEKDEKGSS
jgi:hypothetical protein